MPKKFVMLLFTTFLIFNWQPAVSAIFQGGVEKQGLNDSSRVVDSQTNAPINRAKITLPQKNYRTYTDRDGRFDLNTNIDGKTVMSVEKEGYKPYSLTIDDNLASKAIVLGIEKSTPKDITIDTDMLHLGDNNFSTQSANSGEFRVKSIGPYYSKNFKIPNITPGSTTNLVIGSIIGIDTLRAKEMGQNRVSNAYSSPPEVYFNGNKIAEIQINGDGQRIRIPSNLILANKMNEVTIKTGRNLMQTAYTDYDDIEFMNLSVETN